MKPDDDEERKDIAAYLEEQQGIISKLLAELLWRIERREPITASLPVVRRIAAWLGDDWMWELSDEDSERYLKQERAGELDHIYGLDEEDECTHAPER